MISRRGWLAALLGGAAVGIAERTADALPRLAAGAPPRITVYRSPTCGCCGNWVDHLRENGFEVEVHAVADMEAVKADHAVPAALASCHTGLVEGYVVEGHVPAGDVHRLLEERPQAVGLAVPGMPIGSPGMEMGGRKDPYEVVAFDAAGKRWTFARH